MPLSTEKSTTEKMVLTNLAVTRTGDLVSLFNKVQEELIMCDSNGVTIAKTKCRCALAIMCLDENNIVVLIDESSKLQLVTYQEQSSELHKTKCLPVSGSPEDFLGLDFDMFQKAHAVIFREHIKIVFESGKLKLRL